jgi:hypothetical protein
MNLAANSAVVTRMSLHSNSERSRSLAIQIDEELPLYLVLLTGEFASSDIEVTARAECSSGAVRLRI